MPSYRIVLGRTKMEYKHVDIVTTGTLKDAEALALADEWASTEGWYPSSDLMPDDVDVSDSWLEETPTSTDKDQTNGR